MLNRSYQRSPAALRYWAGPHRYSYYFSYRTRSDATIIATRSRNSFIPFMASITFFIIQLDYFERVHSEGFMDWRRDHRSQGPSAMVFRSREFHVGDLSAARVSGIVDASGCDFLWLLPSLRKLNMPLLLLWGPIKHTPESIPFIRKSMRK
jgi:pimeloyl-ACP methyl ester carboxylesterase